MRQQVLTPIEESSLLGTAHADPNSIMCYQLPGIITKDGKPIAGGPDIDKSDFKFMGTIYPKHAPHHAAVSVPALAEANGHSLDGLRPSELTFEGNLRIVWGEPARAGAGVGVD